MSLTVNIEKYINESAAIACKIEDKDIRIRTYALNLAAQAAAEALNKLGINVDTKNSLVKITSFAKSFELADIYVNGCRIDVRITFDGNTFTIPKTHEKYDAVPYAYLVIKLDEKNKQAELLGYLDSSKIEYGRTDTPYYSFSTDILSPVDSLADFIKSLKPSNKSCSVDGLEKIKELCVSFIDDEISESEKVYFIKHVIACPDCRTAFCITGGFDAIVSQIRNYEELLNDSTLSVLSGNKQELDEALLANISLVENAQEDEEETKEEQRSDIGESDEKQQDLILEEPLALQTEEYTEEIKEEQQPLQDVEADIPMLLADTEEPLMLEEDSAEELLLNTVSEDEQINAENTSDNMLLSDNETPEENISDNHLLQETESESLEESPDLAELKPDDETDVLKLEGDDILLEESIPELNLESETADIEKLNTESLVEEKPLENLVDNNDNSFVISNEKDSDSSTSQELLAETEKILDDVQPEQDLQELSPEELILDGHNETLKPDLIFEEDSEQKQAEEIVSNAEAAEKDSILPLELENSDALDSADTYTELKDESVDYHQQESTSAEKIDFNLNNPAEEDESLISFAPQEPVELNYDDESDSDESLSASYDFDFDKEINKENEFPSNTEEETYQKAFDVIEKQPEAENSEIQNLLDDDLMALLADNDDVKSTEGESPVSSIENNYEIDEEQNNFDESQSQNTMDTEEHSDETINSLFENNENPQSENGENQTFELAQEPVSANTVKRTKKLAILAGLLIVMVAAGGTTLVFNHQKEVQNKAQDTANQGDELFDFQNKGSEEDADTAAVPQDINKSMTNSFSDKPAAITITKLSWQVSEKLAADTSVKEYLQTAGKNIQMNLQNDLANSADIAFNNMVKVSFEIAPDNTMKGMQVLESSGSDKIDEIILRSIKNTLKYISVPKLKDYKSDYFLTLIINF